MGGLELPRLARADRVERELHVLAQLRRGLRAPGLVVDQLVARRRAGGRRGRRARAAGAGPAGTRTSARTTPARRPRPGSARGSASAPRRPSPRSWRSSSESPKPPRRQPASSSPSSSGSEPAPAAPAWKRSSTWWTRIPKRWLSVGSRRDPEHARELVLQRAGPVGLDVGRAQHEPVAAPRQERLERRLGARGDRAGAQLLVALGVEQVVVERGGLEDLALLGGGRLQQALR